jgi:ATP-dependent helicase IRC3
MELRPRQIECLDAIRNEYIAGTYQQLIVAATGFGKAVVIANIRGKMADLLQGRILVFAHREELVDQLVDTMREWNPGAKVGKEMANDYADIDSDIVVSCVASIGRNGSTRLARFGEFSIVVCDEAHHSIAATYLNVFESTGVLKAVSTKLLVGFTATPKRKNLSRKEKKQTLLDDEDIIQLKSVYKKIAFNYPIRKAIKEGWLVPLRGYRVKTTVDLSNVKTTAGDYQQDQLSETVNIPQRNAAIVDAWLQNCIGRQTVVFCVDIQHAQDLAAAFRAKGQRFEAIWGADPDRSAKLARHKSKETTGLCNAQLLTEGYDDWRVSCIVDAAPTKSPSKYTQCIGRGTRLQGGSGNLLEALSQGFCLEKKDCIVLDVVDNNRRCSLVTLPTMVGLNPDMDLNGASATEVADKIEEMQDKYPSVDLSQLTDITKLSTYIESLDLFAEPYTQEVKELSKLTWMTASDGSYVLHIPEKEELKRDKQYARFLHEKLHIAQNELDEWVLSITSVSTNKLLATYDTLKEAFESADEVVVRCRPDRMKLLRREAEWHNYPATDPAKKLLRSLSKGKAFPKCLCPGIQLAKLCPVCRMTTGITAGEAATAINLLKARKI